MNYVISILSKIILWTSGNLILWRQWGFNISLNAFNHLKAENVLQKMWLKNVGAAGKKTFQKCITELIYDLLSFIIYGHSDVACLTESIHRLWAGLKYTFKYHII